ncbi:MAG: hypothetical protein JWN18_451 [Parcubacteria group bacterium]|nr:hypothetical protein [Parcubacteria group bacterium]
MREILFGLLIVLGVIYGADELYYLYVTSPSVTVAAPRVIATLPTSSEFVQTGTLIFYPNNVGPVPYLMYANQKGVTVSKALVLVGGDSLDLSHWTGARVSVTGVVVDEHVVVSSLLYLSGP